MTAAKGMTEHHTGGGPVMSVIIGSWRPGPGLRETVNQIRSVTDEVSTEIIVASNFPWQGRPRGVRVVTTPSASRGDRFDAASEVAKGQYLAFIDDWVTLLPGWQRRAIELLEDEGVGAVGGPLLSLRGVGVRHRAAGLILRSFVGIGPRRFLFRRDRQRKVREMPTMNLAVRRDAFRAVGGFQSPTRYGDGARLGYKVTSLLGLEVIYDPDLAGEAVPPALPQPFRSLTAGRGVHRGDVARRMRETSPIFPYALPGLGLVALCLLAVAAPFEILARLALALVALSYAAAGVWLIAASRRDWSAGLLAATQLPLIHLAFAAGFWRGYFGRSLGEISPGHDHDRRLRILVFNWRDITHPWSGGAEQYMHEIAKRWVANGCDVGWVCSRYRPAPRAETIDGIRFYRVGGPYTLYLKAALIYLLRLRRHYDVIVDCENGIPFFTPLFSRKPVSLVVHHVHQEVFRRELRPQLRWLALWLEGTLMPWAYAHCRVVAVSESTRQALGRQGFQSSNVVVVPNGVDLPQTVSVNHRAKVPTFVYLGRLKPYKSVDDLIGAIPEVLQACPDARLEIIGQGPDRQRLERLAWRLHLAGRVRFHGYLTRRSRDRQLSRAWALVCPSAFEGWGVVCMEASARATPVVAADVLGLRDSVVNGVTGTLVRHGDRHALAGAMIDLAADARLRRRMGQSGREWAAQHDWDQSASGFLDMLIEMVPSSWRESGKMFVEPADKSLAGNAS